MTMELYDRIKPATSVYRIPNDDPKAPLFFLVPGNPGLAEFYSEYLTHLKQQLPEFEYFCPAHIGFNTLSDDDKGRLDGHVYTLDEQIKHKVEMLRELTKSNPDRAIVIMGHSVGAWMVQRIVVALPDLNIKFVGLLTPTIQDIASSEKGAKVSMIGDYVSQRPGSIYARVGQAVYWATPTRLAQAGLRFWMGGSDLPQHALDGALRMMERPTILRQFADMGAEEMERITKEPPDEIASFWHDDRYNIWLHFVNRDHWIKDETREEIIERYGEYKNVDINVADESDPIVHAFCVRHSEQFARLTASKVVEASI